VSNQFAQTLAVANLGDSRGLVTIFHERNGAVHAVAADGQEIAGWPVTVENAFTSTMPTIADFDDDRLDEIVISVVEVSVLSSAGCLLPGWPLGDPDDGFQSRTAIVTSLLPDGELYLINGTGRGRIYVVDGFGNPASGWPIQVPGGQFARPLYRNAAVGDVTGDGLREIVATITNDSRVYVYASDGDLVSPFPVEIGGGLDEPTLGDLDGNGRSEIAFWAESTSLGQGGVEILQGDGTRLPGWPQATHALGNWGLAIGNVDEDGQLEIAAATVNGGEEGVGGVYLWNHDGSNVPGWPKLIQDVSFPNPVTIADVTGDGQGDVVVTGLTAFSESDGVVYAWSASGQLINGFPIVIDGRPIFSAAGPTVADLEADGVAELGVASESGIFRGGPVKIHWFDLGVPYRPEGMEWPTRAHDMARTGSYSPPVQRVSLGAGLFPPVIHSRTPAPRLTAVFRSLGDESDKPTTFSLVKVDDEPVEPVEGRQLGGWLGGLGRFSRLVFRFDGQEVRNRLGSVGEHELTFRSEVIGGLGGVQYEATASLTLRDAGWRFGWDREVENGAVGRHQVPLTRSTDPGEPE
jgi:hypothetical protein